MPEILISAKPLFKVIGVCLSSPFRLLRHHGACQKSVQYMNSNSPNMSTLVVAEKRFGFRLENNKSACVVRRLSAGSRQRQAWATDEGGLRGIQLTACKAIDGADLRKGGEDDGKIVEMVEAKTGGAREQRWVTDFLLGESMRSSWRRVLPSPTLNGHYPLRFSPI